MKVINVPREILRFTASDWDIDWRNQSTGASNDGNSQIVFTRFPRWTGSPEIYYSRANVQIWRAIRAAARGRASVYRVPLIDSFSPLIKTASSDIPFSTECMFSTGLGFRFRPRMVAPVGAKAGATEIIVTENSLMPLKVGQFISHNDWPMIVRSMTPHGTDTKIEVEMPLRKEIAPGDEMDLHAYGLFRMADDQTGNPAYGASRTSLQRLDFVEWINR